VLAIENIFGLGQDATPAPTPTVTADNRRNVTLPAVPDNTIVRCKFDPVINGMRCEPVQLLEPPIVFMLAAGGLASLLLGYALGRAQFFSRFAKHVAEDPLHVRRR
jgi:hypothetical protein